MILNHSQSHKITQLYIYIYTYVLIYHIETHDLDGKARFSVGCCIFFNVTGLRPPRHIEQNASVWIFSLFGRLYNNDRGVSLGPDILIYRWDLLQECWYMLTNFHCRASKRVWLGDRSFRWKWLCRTVSSPLQMCQTKRCGWRSGEMTPKNEDKIWKWVCCPKEEWLFQPMLALG